MTPSVSGILCGAKGIAMLTTEAVEPSISGSEIGANGRRLIRSVSGILFGAKGGAMLTTEAVEPSVSGSEIAPNKSRCSSWGSLSGEPPRASISGSEIGAEESRCLDSAGGEGFIRAKKNRVVSAALFFCGQNIVDKSGKSVKVAALNLLLIAKFILLWHGLLLDWC